MREGGALDSAEFREIAAKYDVKAANEGSCDFVAIRRATLEFVNK